MVNFYSCHIVDNCTLANGTVDDVAKHIEHIKEVIGVEHIGLGGDYDGVDRFPVGLENVSSYPLLLAHLYDHYNWTETELEKLTSRNLIRVWEEVERVANKLQNQMHPVEARIDKQEVFDEELQCSTIFK